MQTVAHPSFPDCLFVPAVDHAHAWRILRAMDAAGFRAGFPVLSGPAGLAVTGRMDDPDHVARVDAVRASVQ